MSSLSRLGLGLYELLPDYRESCPLCRGKDCAVRHGLYFRGLVDSEGHFYPRFPVVRFRCRRRGPKPAPDVTFSVLPAQAVPRRHISLGLMGRIVDWVVAGQRTFSQVLDQLAQLGSPSGEPLLLQELTVYRILLVFAALYARLLSFPVEGTELPSGLETTREQAGSVAAVLTAQPRGSPQALVMAFHRRYFPHLLADVRLTAGPSSAWSSS